MRIRDTLAQLAANRPAVGRGGSASGRMSDLGVAFDNPGQLGARVHIPAGLPAGAPLVVVLHGCTQTPDGYDTGTGWSRLADRAGFALLFPEQRRANNPNLCFNWFQPGDIARDGGEAASIARMVEATIAHHALDRQRVFVTGLSAGGAMTAVMLATYPELFAGGAIIGGLPYGCAQSVAAALERMAGRGNRAIPAVAQGASQRWPAVSVWHGAADATVVVGNMDDIAAQWCDVHGVADVAPEVDQGANWQHRTWRAGDRTVVETWRIAGMGHGVPIDPGGPDGLGTAGAYMLAVGIDSTAAIARSWGLMPASAPATVARSARAPAKVVPLPLDRAPPAVPGVQGIIEDALRAAGLMK